jgi:hypothetical protein
MDSGIGHPDFVYIGINQAEANGICLPFLLHATPFSIDITSGFLNGEEEFLLNGGEGHFGGVF